MSARSSSGVGGRGPDGRTSLGMMVLMPVEFSMQVGLSS
jgi:hypothetical protein